MREFRMLRLSEIECRIADVDKKGRYVRLLLYKTARTDYALLDEKFGIYGWQNDYKIIDGKMYCGIGIKAGNEWIWKWNCGTESNTEGEKGQASDALKRAGFALGLGTELYSSPQITIFADKCNIVQQADKWKCFDRFTVENIEYDENEEISALTIRNEKSGMICYSYTKKLTEGKKSANNDKLNELQNKISENGLDEPLPWENPTEESILQTVRVKLAEVMDVETMNKAVEIIKGLSHIDESSAKSAKLIRAKANELGLKLNRSTKLYE